MWIDRVSSTAITALAVHIQAYQTTFFVLAVVSSPVPGSPTVRWAHEGVPAHRSMGYICTILPLFLTRFAKPIR